MSGLRQTEVWIYATRARACMPTVCLPEEHTHGNKLIRPISTTQDPTRQTQGGPPCRSIAPEMRGRPVTDAPPTPPPTSGPSLRGICFPANRQYRQISYGRSAALPVTPSKETKNKDICPFSPRSLTHFRSVSFDNGVYPQMIRTRHFLTIKVRGAARRRGTYQDGRYLTPKAQMFPLFCC